MVADVLYTFKSPISKLLERSVTKQLSFFLSYNIIIDPIKVTIFLFCSTEISINVLVEL